MTPPVNPTTTDNKDISPATPSPAPPSSKPLDPPPPLHHDPPQDTVQDVKAPPPSSDNPGDIIDMEAFLQILDLDEEGNDDFSKGMAWAYFDQAATTFDDMADAYAAKDLPKLSSLGHFLKGSSAALGVAKVQASCERIQHYGELRDEEVKCDLSPADALALIDTTLKLVKKEYAEAEEWLKSYYASKEQHE